ncbi:MAG: hypothetical protein MI922_19790, partial [Bacteroidales bacterium]|nr:hypothetical protein [Bacteroidales bacterium]
MIFCCWCMWSCSPNTETEVIRAYLKYYNSKNYKALDKILADTVVYIEDDVAETYTKADFFKEENTVNLNELKDGRRVYESDGCFMKM